ncbi:mitochondrial folate transporter-like protein/carrier [Polychaeton citri CBS 116435]|uniref:Mitochondrial folate transporter-like protein/carrier n=1 Tax=Polychaeton citri CBS 116435 TaxID=1314669 RepID=A0A9P4Q740_9PEZI|nr:mitochondrial folate transporter-like protein/carrier [Polychaeton citri CBS 116435]
MLRVVTPAMPPKDSDTHDHGPPGQGSMLVSPSSAPSPGAHTLSSFPKLAVWSATLPMGSVNSFSGAMAGVASGIVTCPLDVIKTKLQGQGSYRNPALKTGPPASEIYRGLVGTGRTIIKQDGLRGMYRGLGPMLLGYLPTWAVYMAVYDATKTSFANNSTLRTDQNPTLARVYASITAGACSTLATNPIWVIKTRLMSQVSRSASDGARTPWQYNNTWDAARKMYAAEGLRAFYSGLAPALLGLTHVAIQFPLYEFVKERLTGVAMGEVASKDENAQNYFGILAATFVSKFCATTATYPHEVLRTRLQTQQRNIHPTSHDGMSGSHNHGSYHGGSGDGGSKTSRRVGTADGMSYKPKYQGILNSCKIILKEEGWRAFYNGMGTNMIRAVPAAMTTMLTFETIKGNIVRLQEEGKTLLAEQEGR